MKFKVACIQTSSGENPDKNISNLEKLLTEHLRKNQILYVFQNVFFTYRF